MKERVLVVVACVLSCVVIFGSIIAYKEHKKANADIDTSQSITNETEENTSVEEETTTKASEETEHNSSETTTSNKPDKMPVSSTKATPKKTTTTTTTTEESTTEKTYPVLAESKADMVRVVNSLTASASKGNYKLTRVCYAKKEFGNNDTLNGIIQNVNPKATFNSAFNDYLGVGTTTATVKNGKATTNIREEYLLKAMSITEGDVRNWRQKDNKITVNIVGEYTPATYTKITNDYISHSTFMDFFNGYTSEYPLEGVRTYYELATLELTIDDGKLTSLKINCCVYADLEIPCSNELSGVYITETTYSDIVYN